MSPGEIHLATFPFGGTVGAKPRPVLLLVRRPANPVILAVSDVLDGADVLPGFQCLVQDVFP